MCHEPKVADGEDGGEPDGADGRFYGVTQAGGGLQEFVGDSSGEVILEKGQRLAGGVPVELAADQVAEIWCVDQVVEAFCDGDADETCEQERYAGHDHGTGIVFLLYEFSDVPEGERDLDGDDAFEQGHCCDQAFDLTDEEPHERPEFCRHIIDAFGGQRVDLNGEFFGPVCFCPVYNIFHFYGFELAEEVGFEPTVGVNPRRFSRPLHSTALPLLRRKYRHKFLRFALIASFFIRFPVSLSRGDLQKTSLCF